MQKIPTTLKNLQPGEMAHSRLPAHRLEKMIASLKQIGIHARLDPTVTGYLVVCVSRETIAQDAQSTGGPALQEVEPGAS